MRFPILRKIKKNAHATETERNLKLIFLLNRAQDAYRRYGYELIAIPASMSLSERCKFVEDRIGMFRFR